MLEEIKGLCTRPCFEVGYAYNLRKFHLNSMSDESKMVDPSFWISHFINEIFFP